MCFVSPQVLFERMGSRHGLLLLVGLFISPLVSALTLDDLQNNLANSRWCAPTSIKPAP